MPGKSLSTFNAFLLSRSHLSPRSRGEGSFASVRKTLLLPPLSLSPSTIAFPRVEREREGEIGGERRRSPFWRGRGGSREGRRSSSPQHQTQPPPPSKLHTRALLSPSLPLCKAQGVRFSLSSSYAHVHELPSHVGAGLSPIPSSLPESHSTYPLDYVRAFSRFNVWDRERASDDIQCSACTKCTCLVR